MGHSKASRATFLSHIHAIFLIILGAVLVMSGPAHAQGKGGGGGGGGGGGEVCERTITANVVAIDQPLMFNRLGAQNVNGMMYALQRDVIAVSDPLLGTVYRLRPDKRPRPLVLRVAAGDCLEVTFTNLLAPNANPNNAQQHPNLQINDQVAGRKVGLHPAGLELVTGMGDDASFVGKNASSLVGPGDSPVTYKWYAPKEGAFLVSNPGATFGGEGTGGNIGNGLFGAVMVEPAGARFYRSQVAEEEMRLATTTLTPSGQPIIDYEARYPNKDPWRKEGKRGLPVLNMLDGNELVHSDINAIIAGPNPDGTFPPSTYPLESVNLQNPTIPNRLEPFREFASIWHDETAAAQAFPAWFGLNSVVSSTLHGVRDSFMINYGSGGIGSEIIASRLGVGPMHDCLDCAYEEFFLTSFTVGDPAMIVDVPANVGLEACDPTGANCEDVGPKATAAFYPADPANVHHSYQGDKTKFRNIHAGPKEQHIFHLHNHQWLFDANDDNSNYLDAQGIGPGSGYTYEIAFGGAGNRNKTVGDAIFHCHFYPHFAQGMWYLWRIHDVMETGTELAVSNGRYHANAWDLKDGTPAVGARAYPDGEILAGTPIPAVVPLPGKPMPPMPGRVTVAARDVNNDGIAEASVAQVDRTDTDEALESDLNPTGLKNPGYPFWIAGIEDIVGQRPPTPPLDMLTEAEAASLGYNQQHAGGFDGGLPRHALEGFKAVEGDVPGRLDPTIVEQTQSPLDMAKVMHKAKPVYYPEEGTDLEKVAMDFHATRNHPGVATNLDGSTSNGNYVVNGGPPVPGAPYNEPCIDDKGIVFDGPGQFFAANGFFTSPAPQFGASNPRVYKGANIQIDAVFNKVGYHYPQQRIIALWDDVWPTIVKDRPPEPFVMRLNTFDCAKYLHANLTPEFYELDDYQVRTPTDIIGQHIHLPKWDLTTADGAANGWNYEDGTLSPGMVRERIAAINHYNEDPTKTPVPTIPGPDGTGGDVTHLTPEEHPVLGPGPIGPDGEPMWIGARTTIQRWFADPVVNTDGIDRGLGIVFTHDHYGPSSVQQVGLYSTLLVEPAGSTWVHNETDVELGTRPDGGPTSWQARILTGDTDGDGQDDSYREFYFEYSDFQHAYEKDIYVGADSRGVPLASQLEESPTCPEGLDKCYIGPPVDGDAFKYAINPSYRQQASTGPEEPRVFPDIVRFPQRCANGLPRPCPEAISADDPGMLVINYRNEPIGLRVYDPDKKGPDEKPGTQADGLGGDLAFALQTRTDRAIPELNSVLGDTPYPPLTGGLMPGDPFTPLLRVYSGDTVRIKVQSGAHEHEHNVTVHGVKWLQGGSGFGQSPNSGWRNSQNDGISEQFTFKVPVDTNVGAEDGSGLEDYAYTVDASQDGYWSGTWGIMRAYQTAQADLPTLPNNQDPNPANIVNRRDFNGACPADAPLREYTVVAVLANDVLGKPEGVTIVPGDSSANMHVGAPLNGGGTLVYNSRGAGNPAQFQGPLHDPTGIMYVLAEDLEPKPGFETSNDCSNNGGNNDFAALNAQCPVQLKADAPVEPLVLRGAAGDCIEATLYNRLPALMPDLAGYNTLLQVVIRDRNDPQGVTTFQNNLVRPSSYVGLHAQLVEYDISKHDGTVVGLNPAPVADGGAEDVQVVGPLRLDASGQPTLADPITYRWYAGHLDTVKEGVNKVRVVATPVELGGANIVPADKIKQGQKGLVAALVIEPQGSAWTEDAGSRASASVGPDTDGDGTPDSVQFRDFAVVHQKGLNHRFGDGKAVENIAAEGQGIPEDSHDAGQWAINYGSEPLWYRFGLPPDSPFGGAPGSQRDVPNPEQAYSNNLAGGADPETPVFTAEPGQEARMRVLLPTGAGRGTTFTVHGHNWQRAPYVAGTVPSQSIGDNWLSMYLGGQESVTPSAHFDLVLPSAGGTAADNLGCTADSPCDFLFRDQASFGNLNGLWGILRVSPPAAPGAVAQK